MIIAAALLSRTATMTTKNHKNSSLESVHIVAPRPGTFWVMPIRDMFLQKATANYALGVIPQHRRPWPFLATYQSKWQLCSVHSNLSQIRSPTFSLHFTFLGTFNTLHRINLNDDNLILAHELKKPIHCIPASICSES